MPSHIFAAVDLSAGNSGQGNTAKTNLLLLIIEGCDLSLPRKDSKNLQPSQRQHMTTASIAPL
jgi:hypothetical protein